MKFEVIARAPYDCFIYTPINVLDVAKANDLIMDVCYSLRFIVIFGYRPENIGKKYDCLRIDLFDKKFTLYPILWGLRDYTLTEFCMKILDVVEGSRSLLIT
jgi:hypothetical protein